MLIALCPAEPKGAALLSTPQNLCPPSSLEPLSQVWMDENCAFAEFQAYGQAAVAGALVLLDCPPLQVPL